jgi:hypothetical protein
MLRKLALFLLCATASFADSEDIFDDYDEKIVLATKQLSFEGFPEAFNPSLTKWDRGFLLTFRYSPDRIHQHWLSEIAIVVLDEELNPITDPQVLNTRVKKSKTPSQAEDARFFTYRGKLFLIYNDNVDEIFYEYGKRRDPFIAELLYQESSEFGKGGFKLAPPLKLVCEEKYAQSWQQKNWVPFEWQGSLFFTYSINPHEILGSNLRNGLCYSLYKTTSSIQWEYGTLRGSSDAQLVDGEFWAFFHSGAKMRSSASFNAKAWHYFMGLYTFSAEPPFAITQMTQKPILSHDFYTRSHHEKRVIFPGGFVVDGSRIYVAYGKDDREIWIATLDKEQLKKNLTPVHP